MTIKPAGVTSPVAEPPAIRSIAPPLYMFTAAVGGITAGFVSITLGYVLVSRAFSVAAIAELVALNILPLTWRVLIGPMFDLSLTPRHWFLLSAIGAAVGLAPFAFVGLDPANLEFIDFMVLALGVFYALGSGAQTAAIAITSETAVRGRIAGWVTAGNLGGVGVGGGLGLWLATHAGMTTAALTLAALCLVCASPMLLIRTPRTGAAQPFRAVVAALGRDAVALVSTRLGWLTIIAISLPMGQGAFIGLLPSVAKDWGASADLTASTTGLLAGMICVPGSLIGGYLCDRYPPQHVLAWSGIACALGEVAMAFGPRTPAAFFVFALANNLLLGVAYAAVAAVIYVGLKGSSGGTMGSLLGSLCNVPVVATTLLLGAVSVPYGANGMMLTEAALGVGSALLYGMMAWLWRPRLVGAALAA
ncbi:MFS transporter [Glacieibacterium megasporae]|uniref:MFS transporter n=1 Tax=Glacieibacterium megasporae TaxID=2835787 RepID=UPI001C1E7823|nr:MFS transporter [Polymorphobacter megasporae]UAJ09601.1 MFS transporter [Polymorphobacter megasporae]